MVFVKRNSLKSDIFFNPIFIPGFSGSGSRVWVQGPGFRSSRISWGLHGKILWAGWCQGWMIWHGMSLSENLFRTCSDSPVLNGRLPFWEDNPRLPVSSENLPSWDHPVRYLWIFQGDHTFYKLYLKFLAISNIIWCISCSWSPSSSWTVDNYFVHYLLLVNFLRRVYINGTLVLYFKILYARQSVFP